MSEQFIRESASMGACPQVEGTVSEVYNKGVADGLAAGRRELATLLESLLHVPAVNKALGDFVSGLVENDVQSAISDYNPTEHSDFDSAVESVIDNYDLSDKVSDEVNSQLDDQLGDRVGAEIDERESALVQRVIDEIKDRL